MYTLDAIVPQYGRPRVESNARVATLVAVAVPLRTLRNQRPCGHPPEAGPGGLDDNLKAVYPLRVIKAS